MSQLNRGFSRRTVVGGGVAAALGIAALGVTLPGLLRKRYRRTPYDDVLGRLVDRDAAVILGKAAIDVARSRPRMEPFQLDPEGLAQDLRHRLEHRSLSEVTHADLAQGHLVEVRGWVLPQMAVLLSVLAATQA